ncbi:uncharacterized protein LOC143460376 [Clavelina lepadiformis]|uniref:uncharacterized protein LOC143460376 n=1 Tax=Clavelina lepadiformis TaxID=159417 RepID=UPI004040FADF
MKDFLKLCLILMSSVCPEANVRNVRSGGKVTIRTHIQAPEKLRKGEAPASDPGWTHCVKNIPAKLNWRAINNKDFTKIETTQFQCTWKIYSLANEHVQISIQKLNFGSEEDSTCQQQFLEIIDSGKTQGRYCERNRPGDYVSSGSAVRVDIQGDDELANLVRSKKSPFIIIYRSVKSNEPGFRTTISKPRENEYDRFHITTSNIRKNKRPNIQRPTHVRNSFGGSVEIRKSDDYNDSRNKVLMFGALDLGGLIAVIVCSILVVLVVFLIILKSFCCKPANKEREKPDSKNPYPANGIQAEEALYPPPYGYVDNTFPLPGNEEILTSEVIQPATSKNSNKPPSLTSKKDSDGPILTTSNRSGKVSHKRSAGSNKNKSIAKDTEKLHHGGPKSKKNDDDCRQLRSTRAVIKKEEPSRSQDRRLRAKKSSKSKSSKSTDAPTSRHRSHKQHKEERKSKSRSMTRHENRTKSSKRDTSRAKRDRSEKLRKPRKSDPTPPTRHRRK